MNNTPRTFDDYVDAFHDELAEAYAEANTRLSFIGFCFEKWNEYKNGPLA